MMSNPTAYKQFIIPDIHITSGICKIGVYSDANPGNWVTLDDVELVPVVPATLTWTNLAGGSWATAGNWSNNNPANGADVTADFSTLTLAADPTVTSDGATTVGHVRFGDVGNTYDWTLDPGSGGTLILSGINTPVLTVDNRQTTIAVVLAGTTGMLKAGTGLLKLEAANA